MKRRVVLNFSLRESSNWWKRIGKLKMKRVFEFAVETKVKAVTVSPVIVRGTMYL